MTDVVVPSFAKKMTFEAVVIRADGTREDLGTIVYWHRNPLKRWAWRLKQIFKGR